MTRTVDIGGLGAAELALAEGTLASLPVSFRSVTDPAEVSIVSGAGDWAAASRLAIDAGATAVLVVQPDPWPATPASGPGIVLVERFAGNPALLGDAVRIPATVGGIAVQVTAPGGDPDSLVFEAVRTLRAIGITDIVLETAVRSAGGVVVDGRAAGGRLSVVAADGPVAELRVEVIGAGEQTSVHLHDAGTARPAHVSWTDSRGTTIAPTVYETAFRAALRLAAADGLPDPVPAFVDDAALVGSIR